MGLLSLIVFLPLLGVLGMLVIPESRSKTVRQVALLSTVLTFAASLAIFLKFDSDSYGFQLVESTNWIAPLGIGYRIGIDGISLWLVLLTTLLSIFAVGCSFKIDNRVRAFMSCVLILETAMLGSFVSTDLVLFFVFFELTLIPMWVLINVWGGSKRARAASKFLIYTFAGSIFMLIGIISLGYLYSKATGTISFDLVQIQSQVAQGKLWTGALGLEPYIFWSFAVAFLVKSPGFPFHTWIPDTYTESPTAGVILSSAMVKMGSFGLLRFCLPLFPDTLARQAPALILLAVVGIVYGAAIAIVQPDMRRLMAYSSLSHMGFVLLGIFSLTRMGVIGGVFQQLSHGITATLLFLLIGYLYERRGSNLLSAYGGLKARVPMLAALFLIAMLSSVGLPGTNGFVGEFFVLLGTYQAAYAKAFSVGLVVAAAFGVVLAAGYMLYMFQRLFYGEITDPENRKLPDLRPSETVMAGALVVFILWGGLAPNTFLAPMRRSVDATVLMAQPNVMNRARWDNAADVPLAYYRRAAPLHAKPRKPIKRDPNKRLIKPAGISAGGGRV